ncbi:unnamed protein product [Polarella glacialis]|uniref:Uncharacterized protein n=1 Tax=Polarella glacialis TaxID=89957 RepID=A0A813HFX0_POLGL|nr:unnamed protein product [Polarella glacialis]CAE8691910.1 unnamed protein product [Polarella glacialis]
MSLLGSRADRLGNNSLLLGSLVSAAGLSGSHLESEVRLSRRDDDGLSVGSSARPEIDRRAVWGLYCSWAMVGLVYGFVGNYINIPICEYVFGPMDSLGRSTTAQCNIAPTITCLPWNFQVFYGLFLDRVCFFGTRRIGWIIFGWTMALIVLGVICFFVDSLVAEGDFFTYMILMMVMCSFYIFSTVASDAMTIEFGKLEPPESRGYILTTAQMVRFATTVFVNVLGIIGMNGKDYYPAGSEDNGTIFPFELKFWQVHLVLLCLALPLYVAMVCLLKDPPAQVAEEHHTLQTVISTLWTVVQTKVMLCLIVFGIGSISVASLTNPAANIIAFIATPSTLQISLGTLVGNLLFLSGVWLFRKYFMNTNWRMTFIWTALLLTTNSVFQLLVIYNAWGVGQSGWFYAFGSNILMIIQGVAQVLSSLAVIEIAPPGFEASIYEFLTSMHNSGIALNTNFQNLFLPIFQLNGIPDLYKKDLANRALYNSRLAAATYFTIVTNLVGSAIFCWFLPKDKAQCKTWFAQWQRKPTGVFNLAFGGGALFFSLVVSVLSGLPSTDCLKIAGGPGC